MPANLDVHEPQPADAGADDSHVDVRTPLATDPWLEHERLDVYRVALEFQQLAAAICRRRGLGALRDQLDRASVSIVLNCAEGAGRVGAAEKRQFFGIAKGSSTECGAALDLLLARGSISAAEHRRGRALLLRIVSMLVGLIRRFSA